MREFDKNTIGKVFIANNIVYVIVGYDYLMKEYISLSVNSSFFDNKNTFFRFRNYVMITDKQFEELKNIDEMIEQFSNDLKEAEIYYIYQKVIKENTSPEKCKEVKKDIPTQYSQSVLEFEKVFTRIRECYFNIYWAKQNYEWTKHSDYDVDYKREIIKHEKGLKRAKKRLFRYCKEDYDFIVNYIEANQYPYFGTILANYREKKNVLDNLYKIKESIETYNKEAGL